MLTVEYLSANLSKKGMLEDSTLTLGAYNDSNEYLGKYAFAYQHDTNIINPTTPSDNATSQPMLSDNANNELEFLDGQIKRLPLVSQMALLDFPQYVLLYNGTTQLSSENAIIDGSDGRKFPILTFNEYQNGDISKQLIYYRCDSADTTTLYGNRDFVMEYDYYINNNQIFFTRDYGEFPILRISYDNGINWADISFDKELFSKLSVTKRIIHFFNETDGYVGLGTDWSMGAGETKYCLFTNDGGITWLERRLPMAGSSSTLTGLCFSDSKMVDGVVSLKSSFDDFGYPTLFFTNDNGENWTDISFPWEQLPGDVSYLAKVDSLSFEEGVYTLVLEEEEQKVSSKSESLAGEWSFVSSWQAVTHTVG